MDPASSLCVPASEQDSSMSMVRPRQPLAWVGKAGERAVQGLAPEVVSTSTPSVDPVSMAAEVPLIELQCSTRFQKSLDQLTL